ncbi:MAG: 3-phosphoshikimate 1-carboxyvinyltransferase, partial [Bacillota bacterium]
EGCRVVLQGQPILRGKQLKVPGDISAAAFIMVAAVIIPGSEVLISNVGVNPLRTGIIDVLKEMGAEIEFKEGRTWGKEPVADIMVRGGKPLKGIEISGAMVPRLIDEIPALVVAAAVARGKTVISDADELRVKESDRISALAGQFKKLGVNISEKNDGMVIEGGSSLTGADVESCGDHRLAMALAVAGLVAEGETAIKDAEVINVSFPDFMAALRSLMMK